ncbi:MAG: hypothetical protein LBH97_06825 [Treponema sp.]|jgi:hypothetical protein|nr:hypothetical protein [Treponema sp.]
MNIRINGQEANIQVETEKTVGEILAGLEQWLENSGHRLSGMTIDGELINSGSIEASFCRNIDSISTLDIITSSLQELTIEGLTHVLEDIEEYENLDFDGKQRYAVLWEESPAARLLAGEIPELFTWITQTFSGEGLSPQALRPAVEERLREIQDPMNELGKTEPIIAGICVRLEELPLDIQTGKDARAAETLSFFSAIAGKFFRIFNLLKVMGFPLAEIKVEEKPVAEYISEFSAALREIVTAYEQRDTVLVGDLAEYELSPRLRNLSAALLHTGSVAVPVQDA